MLWLLQNNFVERMTGRLAWALHRHGQSMHDFSLVPGRPLPRFPAEAFTGPAFAYGSTALFAKLSEADAWRGRLFGTPADFDQRKWGACPKLLNTQARYLTIGELRQALHRGELPLEFFARPVTEHKAFAGTVVREGRLGVLEHGPRGTPRQHPENLLVAVSPVAADIRAEYRFWVLDGEPRLASRYRQAGVLSSSPEVPALAWEAAREVAGEWTPARMCVMDLALLANEDWRVVEFNCVHCAGLYEAPLDAFIETVREACR